MDDPVVAKVVSDESEAELVCGLLRAAGIECGYRDTEALDSTLEAFMAPARARSSCIRRIWKPPEQSSSKPRAEAPRAPEGPPRCSGGPSVR